MSGDHLSGLPQLSPGGTIRTSSLPLVRWDRGGRPASHRIHRLPEFRPPRGWPPGPWGSHLPRLVRRVQADLHSHLPDLIGPVFRARGHGPGAGSPARGEGPRRLEPSPRGLWDRGLPASCWRGQGLRHPQHRHGHCLCFVYKKNVFLISIRPAPRGPVGREMGHRLTEGAGVYLGGRARLAVWQWRGPYDGRSIRNCCWPWSRASVTRGGQRLVGQIHVRTAGRVGLVITRDEHARTIWRPWTATRRVAEASRAGSAAPAGEGRAGESLPCDGPQASGRRGVSSKWSARSSSGRCCQCGPG